MVKTGSRAEHTQSRLSRILPARDRFRLNASEASGAFGDLGTFLPYTIGAVTVVGMAPAGVLAGFGLYYIGSGLFYGLPMAVQPMKAVSASMLAHDLGPAEIAAAGLIVGVFFLLAGLTGLITRVAEWIPSSVAAGLQLGLAMSLVAFAVQLIFEDLWFGIAISVALLILLQKPQLPAALLVLIAGVGVARFMGDATPMPALQLGLHLPTISLPDWNAILRGTEHAAIPQIPLTVTNAIIVAAAVTRQLYPQQSKRATPRNLSLTTGIGNLMTAPFGGFPMCHGAGGVAAHHRFGARTAAAPLLIGIIFLSLALFLGNSAMDLLLLIPTAVIGSLLFFAALELAFSARVPAYGRVDLGIIFVIAAIGFLVNLALAFAVGLVLAFAVRRWGARNAG